MPSAMDRLTRVSCKQSYCHGAVETGLCSVCDHWLNHSLIKWGLGEGCRRADGVGVGTGSVCTYLNRFLWESSRSDGRGL